MIENIEVLCHSSIKMKLNNNIIYIDPFRIQENMNDGDIILITHSHYDHFSIEDIKKVIKDETIIVLPHETQKIALENGIQSEELIVVEPNNCYNIKGIKIETILAYNENKKFHPKGNGWIGYVIEHNNKRYYIAGDTDITKENKQVRCDVALVPIGGTYTMDYKEAAELVNYIKPEIAIPTHYGEIVGEKKDAEKFASLLNPEIKCKILIK